jgi:hypothetical protein
VLAHKNPSRFGDQVKGRLTIVKIANVAPGDRGSIFSIADAIGLHNGQRYRLISRFIADYAPTLSGRAQAIFRHTSKRSPLLLLGNGGKLLLRGAQAK